MWGKLVVRHATPILALAFCIGIVLGGSLPEFGNLAAYFLWGPNIKPHFFNDYFLVAGILGVIICGITLVRRRSMEITSRMVKRKENTI